VGEWGLYLDADSTFTTPMSQILKKDDRYVYGSEGNPYDTCYVPSNVHNRTDTKSFAEGYTVVNWMLLSAPKHPFLTQALYNIVDNIRQQYLGKPFLHEANHLNYRRIVCTTGPAALSAAMSEVITKTTTVPSVKAFVSARGLQYRYVGRDFAQYGAVWKVDGDTAHYSDKGNHVEFYGAVHQHLLVAYENP
jgi:hypothetical protein